MHEHMAHTPIDSVQAKPVLSDFQIENYAHYLRGKSVHMSLWHFLMSTITMRSTNAINFPMGCLFLGT